MEKLSYTLTYYNYHSDTNRTSYGQELDAALQYQINDRCMVGWKFGNYWAGNLYTDSLRTSAYASFSF